MKIIQTPAAVRDVSTIADWIAEHNLDAALNFFDDVDRILKLLCSHPLMGEAVDELSPGLRRHTFGNYLIFYRPQNDALELVRVLHGSRKIENLFD